MSEGLGDRAAALITGAAGLAFSVVYVVAARRIEDSLLADPVGASGVPVAVGGLMGLASLALIVKGVLTPVRRSEPTSPAQPRMLRPHVLAVGLLVILAVYLLALPWLGYVVSIGLMAAAVAWFGGGRQARVLVGFAVLTGPLLWLLFDLALRVRMPTGIWRTLLAG